MKKVVIFSLIGGHNIVSQALHEKLSESYAVTVANIFLDVLAPMDLIRTFTFGRYNSEDCYSFCMRKRLYRLMNKSYVCGLAYYYLRAGKVEALIKEYVQKHKADAIISVVPFFNVHLLKVAQELNIPFIIMPTDVDINTFIYKMTPINYNKFHLAITLEDPSIYRAIKHLNIKNNQISVTGVALKKEFFKEHDKQAIKRQLNIIDNRPVILLLMGSQGSASMVDFVRELTKIRTINCHLIIVLGCNDNQKNEIMHVAFPSNITYSLFGFTDLIPEFMAISTLLITKSGGISTSEALYMNLPALFDATNNVLVWEEMNQQFMQNHQFGTRVYNLSELPKMVTTLLTSKSNILDMYRQNMINFEKKNGADSIAKLLYNMI